MSIKNFLKREFNILSKTPGKAALFLIIPFLLGILLSVISRQSHTDYYMYFYNPNIPAWILMLLLSAVFTGIISTGHEFINLRDFRKKEDLVIGKSVQYKMSKLLKIIIITFIQAFVLSFFSVIIVGVEFNFSGIFLIVWTLCFWGACCGLLLSLLFKTTSSVYLLVPVIIIPQILFSGALIEFKNFNEFIRNDKHVPIIAEIIPLRWAGEAVMLDLYRNNEYEKPIFKANINLAEASYYLDSFIPEIIEIHKTDKHRADIIINNERLKNTRFPDCQGEFSSNIEALRSQYRILREFSLQERDSVLQTYINPVMMQGKYTNRSLTDLLLNSHGFSNYNVYYDEIVRNFMPVYKLPDKNSLTRSHYFSPCKIFMFNYYIDTYIYNVLVLLFFNFLIVVAIFFVKEKK